MNFIDDQVFATSFYEFIGEVCQSMLGEVKIFGGYIEDFLRIEVGFDVLEHEGGFSNTARATEAVISGRIVMSRSPRTLKENIS